MSWFFVAEIFTTFTKGFIALIFFRLFLGRGEQALRWQMRESQTISFFSLVAGLFTAILILRHIFITNNMLIFLITAGLLFAMALLFRGSVGIKLFATALLVGFMMLSDLIATFGIITIVGGDLHALYDEGKLQITAMVASVLLLLVITKAVGNFRKNETVRIPVLQWLPLLAAPLISIVVIYTIANNSFANDGGGTVVSPLVFAGILFANTLIFQLFEGYLERIAIKENNRLLQERINVQTAQYKALVDIEQEKRHFFHDYQKHLDTLMHMARHGDANEVPRYILSLQDNSSLQYKQHIYTGNLIVDAIFNKKIEEAKTKGIRIEKSLLFPSDITLGDADLCILFGNAWDNAIEACERIIVGERYIDFFLHYEDRCILLQMTNPTDGQLVQDKQMFKTSKADSYMHGLGLKSMQQVVEKYGGAFNATHDDKVGIFTLSVVIYAPAKRENEKEPTIVVSS